MRRLFWLSVGAAAGYYVARKGTVALEQARERGLVGNVMLAAGSASRLAASASRTGGAVGEAVNARARGVAGPTTATPDRGAVPDGTAAADTAGPQPPARPTSTSTREARP
ncbi:MAG TPA: hypothetical protein VIJ41_04020 [Candidatus Nanopelagicales bacterium]